MDSTKCDNFGCPNRTPQGYCYLTACTYLRWTDKLSLDTNGNIIDFYGNVVGHYTPVMFDTTKENEDG